MQSRLGMIQSGAHERQPGSTIWPSQKIFVHQTHIGRIMGKKGERVKLIKLVTAAQVDAYHALHDTDGQVPLVVRARTMPQVEKAMGIVLKLLESKAGERDGLEAEVGFFNTGSSSARYVSPRSPISSTAARCDPQHGEGEVSEEIYLSAGQVGKLIGTGGCTTKLIQAKTGAFIDVLHYRSTPNGKCVPVLIRGHRQHQVEEAKRMVLELMEAKRAADCATPPISHNRSNSPLVVGRPTSPGSVVMPRVFDKLAIPAEMFAAIKRLLGELEDRFDFIKLKLQESAPPKASSLVITGPSDKVAAAKAELGQLLLRDSMDAGVVVSQHSPHISTFSEKGRTGFPLCEKCGIRKREMLFECGHLTHCLECTGPVPRCDRCGKTTTVTKRLLH